MEDARIAQPYVVRTYLAPERDPGDQREAAALTLLSEVLGGSSQTSELGKALQFDSQVAIYTGAFYSGVSHDDTTFGLIVAPAPGVSLEQAEAALDAEVAAFLDRGVDPEQLDRIKMQLRASQIYEADNTGRLARRYGAALASGLSLDDIAAWPDILQEVTGEDIVAAGRRILDRTNAVTGWISAPSDHASAQEITQ